MTDDPRLKVVGRWIGPKRLRTVPAGEELIPQMLAQLDGVDPLRQPVSQDRVEAALETYWERLHGTRGGVPFLPETIEAMRAGIAAADRVQAPAIKTRLDQELQSRFWKLFDDAKALCESDKPEQWAALYIAVAAIPESQRPDHAQAPAEKPDFPPWSREMWTLLHYLAQKCQGQHPAERETMSYLLDQARRAAVPETQDAG